MTFDRVPYFFHVNSRRGAVERARPNSPFLLSLFAKFQIGVTLLKCPSQAGSGAVVSPGQVLRGAAVEVEKVAKPPVEILSDPQFQ